MSHALFFVNLTAFPVFVIYYTNKNVSLIVVLDTVCVFGTFRCLYIYRAIMGDAFTRASGRDIKLIFFVIGDHLYMSV